MIAAKRGSSRVWSLVWFFLFLASATLILSVLADIMRSRSMSGFGKAPWAFAVIALPFLGVFLHLIVNGGVTADRAVRDAPGAAEEVGPAKAKIVAGLMGTTRRSTHHRRTRWIRAFVIGVGAVALLGACTSDGAPLFPQDTTVPDEVAPEASEPEAPAPEPEAPEPEQPAPEQPAPEPPAAESPVPSDDGSTIGEWIVLIILGVGAFALIMGIVSLSTKHSNNKRAQQSSLRRQIGEVVGLGRWIIDQGSIEVLRASEAHQLDTAWRSLRAGLIDLETRCASMAGLIDDREIGEMILRLAADAAALRGVLDTNVSLRQDPNAATNTVLIDDTTRSLYQRRQEVELDLSRLSAVNA